MNTRIKKGFALILTLMVLAMPLSAFAVTNPVTGYTGVEVMGARGVIPADYEEFRDLTLDFFAYKDNGSTATGDVDTGIQNFWDNSLSTGLKIVLTANGVTADNLMTLAHTLNTADTASEETIVSSLSTLSSTFGTVSGNIAANFPGEGNTLVGGADTPSYLYYLISEMQDSKLGKYDTRTGQTTLDLVSAARIPNTAVILLGSDLTDYLGMALAGMTDIFATELKTVFVDELTAYMEDVDADAQVSDALMALGLLEEYTSTAPSGGGGGGTVVEDPAEEPEIEEPVVEETDGEETVISSDVGNAAEVTVTEDGTEEAVVDDAAVTEAVAGVVEELEAYEAEDGETVTPVVNLNIETETADVSVALQVDTVETLEENDVTLCIQTGAVTYEMPAGTLDSGSLLTDSGDPVEGDYELRFNSEAVDVEEALASVEGSSEDGLALEAALEGKTKIIQLSLDIYTDGDKVGSVYEFKEPLTVRISLADVPDADPDKVGVYYLDEETGKPVFMGGKVVLVDGEPMIEFSTTHYSRYAILEAKVSYPDVTTHWAKAYVESMGAKRIVKGYPDGSFLPEKAVTRAEFAKLVVAAMGWESAAYEGSFTDVAASDWHAGWIAAAAAEGVVNGYADGTFKPDAPITRLEMAAMLCKATHCKLEGDVEEILADYQDSSLIADWGVLYAAKTVENELMNGMDGGFNPAGTTTRAQAATAIYRLYNK